MITLKGARQQLLRSPYYRQLCILCGKHVAAHFDGVYCYPASENIPREAVKRRLENAG